MPQKIEARYPGKCRTCGGPYEVGDWVSAAPPKGHRKFWLMRHADCTGPRMDRAGWKGNREWMTDEEYDLTAAVMARRARPMKRRDLVHPPAKASRTSR
jgi:hypothetical protein